MSLSNYSQWAAAIGQELAELPSPAEWQVIGKLLVYSETELWSAAEREDLAAALRLLEATPAKRRAQWKRVPPDLRPQLWLLTVDLAKRAAKCLAIAADVGEVEGMAYRQAVQVAAQASLPASLSPLPMHLWETEHWPGG